MSSKIDITIIHILDPKRWSKAISTGFYVIFDYYYYYYALLLSLNYSVVCQAYQTKVYRPHVHISQLNDRQYVIYRYGQHDDSAKRKYLKGFKIYCWRRTKKIKLLKKVTNEVLELIGETRVVLNNTLRREAI